jgi:hypothetical protein
MKLKWTLETLQKEANKYETRVEFYDKNQSAYNASSKKNLLNKLFSDHKNKGYCRKKWTKEELQEEVNKYKTRHEFYKKNSRCYFAAHRKNILDKLFINHKNKGYADKEEWKNNLYTIYVYEIKKFNKAYIGLTKKIERRDKEHLFNLKEKLNIFCQKNNIPLPNYKILEKDLTSKDAQKKEKYWVNFYKNNEWEMFNVAKTGSLGLAIIKWNKYTLQKEANKYKNRNDFSKNKGAYNAAINLNILDDIFIKHVNNGYSEKKVKKGYWTKEMLQKEANKYFTRNEFSKNNKSAYSATSELNLINELFKYHSNEGYSDKKVKRGYWTKENIKKESDKYETKTEFLKNSRCAYKAAFRLNILNELFETKKPE